MITIVIPPKSFLIRLLLTLALVIANTVTVFAQTVDIPDAALKATIWEALGKTEPVGSVSQEEMLSLTSLDASFKGIGDISGLEAAHNLVRLDLSFNQMRSLELPQSLTNLTSLNLSVNFLTTVVLPTNAVLLTEVRIAYHSLSTLTIPAGLSNLVFLDLNWGSPVPNFSIEGNISGITTLSMMGLSSTNLSFMGNLRSLTNLNLAYAQRSSIDISPGLVNLESIDLSVASLTNVTIPPSLTNLSSINLSGTPIRGLTVPPNLRSLRRLYLGGTLVSSLSLPFPVADLTLPSTCRPFSIPAGDPEFLGAFASLRAQGVDISLRPTYENLKLEPGGSFGFDLFADAGDFRLFRSYDFENWSEIGAAHLSTPNYPGIRLVDGAINGIPAAYYKVVQLLRIVRQPESIRVHQGGAASFSAFALGESPSYQWFHEGVLLAGETNAEIHFSHVQLSDSGNYTLQLTNSLGSLISRTVKLLVNPTPKTSFIVTNAEDSGPGSLRQAIENANLSPEGGTIQFKIPSDGSKSIILYSPLPELTNHIVLDGTTQPGFVDRPLVELWGTGAGLGASGLILRSSSVVRGLAINGWPGNGIELFPPGEHVVQGNYIGISPVSLESWPNQGAGVLVFGAHNCQIGGAAPSDRNVISGNLQNGIEVTAGATNCVIVGNYVGTDNTGRRAVPNQWAGILLSSASQNRVGGDGEEDGNLISGNRMSGVNLNRSPSLALPTDGNIIKGNRIGVNVDGNLPLPNVGSGILISGECSNTLIGGTNTFAGNTISGNVFSGIEIVGQSDTTVVLGNRIGTDGQVSRKVPNTLDGILISGAGTGFFPQRTQVGDFQEGAGNVISGNGYSGIEIAGRGLGTQIRGNLIGTGLSSSESLGNSFAGIFVSQEPSANSAGTGAMTIERNTIAFNLEAGVDVQARRSPSNPYNAGISIRQNSIFSNTLLGIDLQPTGRTSNDSGDTDSGANGRQNYPVITNAVITVLGTPLVQGSINSRANESYTLDFYSNEQCDSSGNGEGKTWLGWTSVTTDRIGNIAFSAQVGALPKGHTVITATATDSNGNTSEFSACKAVKP